MKFDKIKLSCRWNSDQNCIKNSAGMGVGVKVGGGGVVFIFFHHVHFTLYCTQNSAKGWWVWGMVKIRGW